MVSHEERKKQTMIYDIITTEEGHGIGKEH